MLVDKKSRLFEEIFAVYNRNLLKRNFSSIRFSDLHSVKTNKPNIFYVNHSSWWDGLVAFQISRVIKADSFVMMEEKHLRKFFLFRQLGAFSVIRENPRQAVESLNYAIKLLTCKPTATLWIFPQGEILPNDSRPLLFYNGLSRVVEKLGNCTVTSLAVRYEFFNSYKPEIFVKTGKPKYFSSNELINRKTLTKIFEDDLTETLDDLKKDVSTQNIDCYQTII